MKRHILVTLLAFTATYAAAHKSTNGKHLPG